MPPCRVDLRVPLVAAAVLLACSSCAPAAVPVETKETVVWRPLGTWSGHGSMQTEAFVSDTGSFRFRWETRNETAPGAGVFRVTLHSDVSGRPLLVAVDTRGTGHDTAYVTEDPRSFFFAVDAANLEWTLAADEGIAATQTVPAAKSGAAGGAPAPVRKR